MHFGILSSVQVGSDPAAKKINVMCEGRGGEAPPKSLPPQSYPHPHVLLPLISLKVLSWSHSHSGYPLTPGMVLSWLPAWQNDPQSWGNWGKSLSFSGLSVPNSQWGPGLGNSERPLCWLKRYKSADCRALPPPVAGVTWESSCRNSEGESSSPSF